jgi:hypothetical protein
MKLLIFIILVFGGFQVFTAFSQTPVPGFHFEYDAMGNRKLREYTTIYVKKGNYEERKAQAGEYVIAVYPNPTKGQITVNISNLKNETPADLKVIGLSGNAVMEIGKLEEANTLDLSKLTNGVYLLEITIDGKRTDWKIVKEE